MRKRAPILVIVLIGLFLKLPAQNKPDDIDSLKVELSKATADTTKIFILEALVRNHFLLGKNEESEAYLKQMDYLVKKTNFPEGIVRFSMEKLRRKFAYTHEWDSALYYGYQGLATLKKYPGEFHASWPLHFNSVMGLIYKNMEEYDSAFHYYNKVINSNKSDDKFSRQSKWIATVNLKNLYAKLGDHKAVLHYTNQLMSIAQEEGNETMILGAYSEFADAYSSIGLYERALEMCNIVIDGYLKDPDAYVVKLHAMYRSKGTCLSKLGNYKEAVQYFRKTLAYELGAYGPNHPKLNKIYKELGINYENQGNYDSAIYYYSKVFELPYDDKSSKKPASLLLMGRSAMKKGDYEAAMKYYQEYFSYQSKDPANNSLTLSLMGDLKSLVGEPLAAIGFYQKALFQTSLNTKGLLLKGLMPSWKNVSILQKIGEQNIVLFKSSGNEDYLINSLEHYHVADSILGKIRSSLAEQNDEIDFNEIYNKLYQGGAEASHLLYELTNEQEYIASAFYFSEKAKSRVLLNALREREIISFSDVPDSLLAREHDLQSRILFYRNKLLRKENLSKEKIKQYEEALVFKQSELDVLTIKIREEHADYYNHFKNDQIIKFQEVQSRLSSDETVVEFTMLIDSLLAFVITDSDIKLLKFPVPNDLDTLVSSYKMALQSVDQYEKQLSYGRKLYDVLVKPIRPYLKTDELIIVPDKVLWFVNFELLPSQMSEIKVDYLLYDYAFSYANSLSHLFRNESVSKSKLVKGCLAFSYSDGSEIRGQVMDFSKLRANGNDIPGTSREIKEIADLISGSYYFGSEANEYNFRQKSLNYEILHLALHGEIDGINPDHSYLKFFESDNDTIDDNRLHAYELYNMKLNANMAVLSACNTGTGQLHGGEGIMSLGRAFQYAGVESMVISNWVLVDEVAPDLVRNFYQNLQMGMSKSKALQQAKISYLKNASESLSNPYFWGAFTLIGNKQPLFRKDYTFLISGVVVIFMICLFLYFRWRKSHSL